MSASHAGGADLCQLAWDLLDRPTVMRFSGRSSWVHWPNVSWTAKRFWEAQWSSSTDGALTRQVAWHHLVMTAGNFKRQAPISLPELHDDPGAHFDGDRGSFRLEVGGGLATLARDDPASWEHLTSIDGVGVATATTILSALWPGFHVIVDRRDIGAAIGLYEEAAHEGLLRSAGYKGEVVSWKRYRWFRRKVVAWAAAIAVEAVPVERALYEIDLATRTARGASWDVYRRELGRVVST